MGTVFVTGATGFLGLHLVRELRALGHEVRGLTRTDAAQARLQALGALSVRGDLADASALMRGCEGAQAVFHTAADTSTWRAQNARQTRVNVDGTQALVQAARAGGVGLLLHTSSVSAWSHLVHGTLREDVPQRGGESWINYERTKFLAEHAVRDSGLAHVVLNPSHILGPGDTRSWSRLILLIDQGRLPGVPPSTGSFADVREVARAHVQAWVRGRQGQRYLLGGEHVSFLTLAGMIGEALGRRTPRRASPAPVLKVYARVLDTISRLTRRMPDVTPEAVTLACHDLVVDSGKAEAELGYVRTPLPALLSDTIAWMRQEGLVRA